MSTHGSDLLFEGGNGQLEMAQRGGLQVPPTPILFLPTVLSSSPQKISLVAKRDISYCFSLLLRMEEYSILVYSPTCECKQNSKLLASATSLAT